VWLTPNGGFAADNVDQLERRIIDVVRRTGGWPTYGAMTAADFPFIQKRFFEEFRAWKLVQVALTQFQPIAPSTPSRFLSTTASLDSATHAQKEAESDEAVKSGLKKMRGPATELEMRDRRELLRRQAEMLSARNATLVNRGAEG